MGCGWASRSRTKTQGGGTCRWRQGKRRHFHDGRPGRTRHALSMPRFTASADYEEKDPEPLDLTAGEEVSVGPVDRAWPGWVWAEGANGRDGYVPEEILEPLGEGRFAAMSDFDPTVLTVRRGDVLESLKQIHGWHWCRNERGDQGWVAGYLMKPAG